MSFSLWTARACTAAILAILCSIGPAAADKLYKWVDADGNLHYTDQPPPPQVKKQERKNFGNKPAATGLPYALQRAIKDYPVTLYSSACGDVCTKAAALLNKRGIPYSERNVKDPGAADELKALTGSSKLEVPVLKLGNQVVRGFEEARWHQELDAAGYPKSPAASEAALKAAVKPAPAAAKPTPTENEQKPDEQKAEPKSEQKAEPNSNKPES